jgi:hypothetical protein
MQRTQRETQRLRCVLDWPEQTYTSPKSTSDKTTVELPSFAVMETGFVDAGCAGSETRHAPSARVSADTLETMSSSLPIVTVTLAPGSAQPHTDAACGACCSTIPSP